MKRWTPSAQNALESPEVDTFLEDLVAVYRKHGLALSHEDEHGAFKVVSLNRYADEDGREANVCWLLDAFDCREEG